MNTITIHISMVDGKLNYRDSEGHKGEKITTRVNRGDKIIWKQEQGMGIKELSGILISGAKNFFKNSPKRKDFDCWEAVVSNTAEGEVCYKVSFDECIGEESRLSVVSEVATLESDHESPKVKIID